jgi:hypothetical protein
MKKKPSSRDAVMSLDAAGWRRRIQQLSIAHADYWPRELSESMEHNADQLADALLDRSAQYGLASIKCTRAGLSMSGKDYAEVVLIAFRAGFLDAVQMHRRELLSIGDVIEEKQARVSGGDKGRRALTTRRMEQAQRIRDKRAELEKAGKPCSYDVIAKEIGCSRSTVDRAINNRQTTRPRR